MYDVSARFVPGSDMEYLGRGAATKVWRNGDRVLKVLTAVGERDRRMLERGYATIMAADINDLSVPRVRRLIRGQTEGQVAVVQDFVSGPTFWKLRRESASLATRCAWLDSALALCDTLWEAGILYADFSAGNIIVMPGDRCALVDFHSVKAKPDGKVYSREPTQLLRMYGKLASEIRNMGPVSND